MAAKLIVNFLHKIQLLPVIVFIVSCTTTENLEFEGQPLIDLDKIYCPSNQIKYCVSRFKTQMECTCVHNNIIYHNF